MRQCPYLKEESKDLYECGVDEYLSALIFDSALYAAVPPMDSDFVKAVCHSDYGQCVAFQWYHQCCWGSCDLEIKV